MAVGQHSSGRWMRRGLVGAAGLFVLLIIVILTNRSARSLAGAARNVMASRLSLLRPPNTRWDTAEPESSDVVTDLDAALGLSSRGDTRAFLLVRDGRLVFEWYDETRGAFETALGPNKKMSLAASGKGVIASLILGVALEDGVVELDDPVSRYVPGWAGDSLRRTITLRQLATHSSGIEDVSFLGDAGSEPWKVEYEAQPARRFDMALHTAPVEFAPGREYRYSGVGYYVLAYALEKAFMQHGVADVRELFRTRITRPLGIHDDDWSLSYGESYSADGLRLYALGSGGNVTARAAAKIGQLLASQGKSGERSLLSPDVVQRLTSYAGTAKPARAADEPEPLPALGWWTNEDGVWESAPRDAFVAAGADHQILLVIPSLKVVAVRFGAPLGDARWGPQYWVDLEELFVIPLMSALAVPPQG